MRRVILLGLLSLAIAGCTRPEGERIHLLYSFWGSVEQMKTERAIVKAFEAENPGIVIDLLPIGARYNEKLQAMMVGQVAPDVIMVEMTQYHEWAARGVLLDVTDEVAALEKQSLTLMPVPRRAFSRQGRFQAVPIVCHGPALYCNLDALRAAGVPFPDGVSTWEQIEAIAPRLSRRAGNPNAPTDYAILLGSTAAMLWAHGGALFDDLSQPTRVTVNTTNSVAAFSLIRRLIARNYAVPPDVAADQGTFQLFRDGKVAFMLDGRWRTPDFAGKTAFEWDVAPIPAGPVRRITQHGGTGLAVFQRSRHLEAAKQFIRFYASARGARMAMLAGRYVPVFRELAFGEEFLALRPPAGIRHFPATMEEGASQAILYAPGNQEVTQILGSRAGQVVAQRDVPIELVVAGLESDLNRWLTKYREKSAP